MHLAAFVPQAQKLWEPIVDDTIDALTGGGGFSNTPCLLQSASKFHYQFNPKDIANIFQGTLNTRPEL